MHGARTRDGSSAVTVSITPAAREVLERAAPSHSAHVRHLVIDVLSPAQLDQLAAISGAILTNLTESGHGDGAIEP